MSRHNGNEAHDRHESQTADLDQQNKDDLPEAVPVRIGIVKHEPRHAGRAGRGEECVRKRRPFVRARGDRQAQKKCTDQNDDQEAERNNLCIAEAISEFSFFYTCFTVSFCFTVMFQGHASDQNGKNTV